MSEFVLVKRELLERWVDNTDFFEHLERHSMPEIAEAKEEDIRITDELRAVLAQEAGPVVERQEPAAMSFDFEHPFSNEKRTVTLTKQDAFDGMEDFFYDKLGEQICQCESVGETNVVDCNCDEYVHDFEIVTACLDKVKELNQ